VGSCGSFGAPPEGRKAKRTRKWIMPNLRGPGSTMAVGGAAFSLTALLPLLAASPPPCSLNGAVVAGGGCSCDPGWAGDACERLNLLPADLSHGANWLSDAGAAAGNASSLAGGGTSTWGATQLRGDDGLWHTFVDEMKQNCGIDGCASLLISQAASLQLSALRCRRSACVLELSACCLWSSQS